MGHHQESDGFHPPLSRQPEALGRDVGFCAVRRETNYRRALAFAGSAQSSIVPMPGYRARQSWLGPRFRPQRG